MEPSQPDSPTPATIDQIRQRETQWRRVGGLLHRLLTQLAAPAMPHDAALDATLDQLREVVGHPTDAARIPVLLKALAQATQAIEAPAAAPAPLAPDSSPALGELLLAVLDRLEPDEQSAAETEALRCAIAGCNDLAALREHGQQLAELVSGQLRRLAADRRAAVRVLHELRGELKAMADDIEQSEAARADDASTRGELDTRILDDVQAIDRCVDAAIDLAELRHALRAHLATIRSHLATLREREHAREDAWRQRVGNLRRRVQKLEQGAREMENMLVTRGHLLDTDALTGLANRRALDARMATLAASAAGARCVLMMDIDHFKDINDRLGHGAGDRALRIVAEQLQATLRPGDFLARYGGEEFLAIVEADLPEALEIAERLRGRLERTRFRSRQQPVQLTLSCGITVVRADDTPAAVLERADQALYRAKRAGRNRCESM